MKLARKHYGWLVWVVFIGILCFIGSERYHLHLDHMGGFIIILSVLCLVFLICLRLAFTQGKQ
ncbi:hypothetical protein ACFLVW_07005 [Chloroflexota bacterium]